MQDVRTYPWCRRDRICHNFWQPRGVKFSNCLSTLCRMSEHTNDIGVMEYTTTSDSLGGENRCINTRVLWKETDVQMSIAERDCREKCTRKWINFGFGIYILPLWNKTYVYSSVLQCVAVCCSVLQCVAVCCSAKQDLCLPQWSLELNWLTCAESFVLTYLY